MPEAVFEALAAGLPSAEAGRFLVEAERGISLLLLKTVAEAAGDGPVRSAFEMLVRLPAVERVLRYPTVGAWARNAARGEKGDGMAALAMAAAFHSGQGLELVVPAMDGVVTLPSAGRAVGSTGRPSDPGGTWLPVRTICASAGGATLRLTIDDLDPYRWPGVAASRLSTEEVTRWQSRLRQAWRLLCRHHGPLASELTTVVSVLVPLPGCGRLSGTSRDTFGSVAASLPATATGLALLLAHEVQHAKLTALLDLVDLLQPDEVGRLYYAPWRPDPRPLGGMLHGAYAHLGVAAFWRRQRHVDGSDDAHAQFMRWRDAAAEGVELVADSGALTALGHRFVDGIRVTLRDFERDQVPAAARRLAGQAATAHRTRYA